ncbi:hypothetical protein [Nonomuraea fuscirosea]|uniref:hypothetical protein n=1 Tax=Nonomuraea fuscirosea TaxID=1291556 RepID=UPI0033E3CAE5
MKGSPPRRRTVLTVWDWSVEAVAEYVEEVRPLFGVGKRPGQPLHPTSLSRRLTQLGIDARPDRNSALLD